MDSYEIFKRFLDNEEFKYAEGEIGDGDRVLRIPQKIQNGGMVNVVFVFAEYKIKIAVLGIAAIEDKGKRVEFYKLFNDFNKEYAFLKMYMHSDGNICVDVDFALELIKGEFQPRALMSFAAMALNAVGKVYPDIMKIQSA